MAAKKRRKGTKMKMNECRETKNGQTYCMTPDGVRFKKSGATLSGSKSRRKKGKTCIRFKRVKVKGTTGKQRRCAAFK